MKDLKPMRNNFQLADGHHQPSPMKENFQQNNHHEMKKAGDIKALHENRKKVIDDLLVANRIKQLRLQQILADQNH